MTVPTGMLHNILPLLFDTFIQTPHSGLDETTPMIRPHNEPLLLPPVIPEIHPIDIVFQRDIHKPAEIITDLIIQPFQLLRTYNHTHKHIFHPHQRPGSLKHAKPEPSHRKPIPFTRHKLLILPPQPRLITYRKAIITFLQILYLRLLHHPNILISPIPVPHNPKFIPEITRTPLYLRRPSPILDIIHTHPQLLPDIPIPRISNQLLQRLPRKINMIRNRPCFFMIQRCNN